MTSKRYLRKKIKYCSMLLLVLMMSMIAVAGAKKKIVKPKKIYLNATKKELTVGSKFKLKIKSVKPSKAVTKVKWKSSNKKVAAVSSKGTVTAKKVGNSTVTATSTVNKKVKAKCKISVVDSLDSTSDNSDKQITTENKADSKNQLTANNPTINPIDIPKATEVPQITESPKITENPKNTEEPKNTEVPKVTDEPKATDNPKTTEEPKNYTVTFKDYDNKELKRVTVKAGEDAEPPAAPKRIGYIFKKWDGSYYSITEDTEIKAVYEKDSSKSIIVGDINVKPGDTSVELPVYINNNPGILGMTLTIHYDDSVMTLKNAVNGDALDGVLVMTKANVLKDGCNFTWDGESLNEEDVKDGKILVLTFDIERHAVSGKYRVSFSWNKGDIVDNNLSALSLDKKEGYVSILSENEKPGSITVKDVVANPGDENVEVPVNIYNNPGILGMTLTIHYDSSVMTLVDSVNGEVFSGVLNMTKSKVLKNGCNFFWDGESVEGDRIKDGTILLLTFKISENAKAGKYSISFTSDDISNNNAKQIMMELKEGYVTVR